MKTTSLIVEKVIDGGFTVWIWPHCEARKAIVFAATEIDDCLSYIKDKLTHDPLSQT